MSTTDEFKQGYKAFKDGIALKENPYNHWLVEATEWVMGWHKSGSDEHPCEVDNEEIVRMWAEAYAAEEKAKSYRFF